MAVWSQATLSGITISDRYDGEYFSPAYIRNEKKLIHIDTTPLPTMFHVSDGNHLSISKYFSKNIGIPYFRGQDINDFFLENSSPIMIPEKVFSTPIMTRSHFHAGDVLLSIVGTIGNLSIVPKSLGPATGSCKIAILRSKGNYSPFVLAAFLLSRFGQLQIQRNIRGTVQMGLILKDLSQVSVPIFGETDAGQIEHLVKHAIKVNRKSKTAHIKAQLLLESELGLDKLKFKKPMGYTARFSELEQSRRADPEHFYPAFQNLVTGLPNSINLVPLGPQLNFCQRGKQPLYANKGLPVINSKHVQNNKVVIEDNRRAFLNNGNELQIRCGDLLMNGTGRGTLGRAAPYLIENPAIPDNHVTILRSPTLDPAYLSFYLNSKAGQLQVEMHQRGTSGQLELYPFDIHKFLVWIAPESFQKEIRKLYDQAAESERESKGLLEQAKSRVEHLIKEAAAR